MNDDKNSKNIILYQQFCLWWDQIMGSKYFLKLCTFEIMRITHSIYIIVKHSLMWHYLYKKSIKL